VIKLNPILLTSPTIRCGTTMLQRLLCSSSNSLIYGEEIAKDLELQLQVYASRKLVYTHSKARFSKAIARVLQGDTNSWIPDLMPDIDGYLEALAAGSFAALKFCQQQASLHGREIWGFKYPGWPPHLIRMLFDVVPKTRIIYIYRDLSACVRSAKAWGEIRTESDTQQFCAQWTNHLNFMVQWRLSQPVILLAYETLLSEPEASIKRLCDFVSLRDLQLDALQHKINNSTEDRDTRRDHHDYIEPHTLSKVEYEIVESAMRAVTIPVEEL
jgi:Sulfotransferase family